MWQLGVPGRKCFWVAEADKKGMRWAKRGVVRVLRKEKSWVHSKIVWNPRGMEEA